MNKEKVIDEEPVVRSVGEIMDILSFYPRSASVFMIKPAKGSNIQRVQVMECCEKHHKIGEQTFSGIAVCKAETFTIGTNGPHNIYDLFRQQTEREKNKQKH